MLGRLRMTVPDCIAEYQNLASTIFGKPRLVCALRVGVLPVNKYNTERLEKVFREVQQRRSEQQQEDGHRTTEFACSKDVCKTYVLCMIQS